jgi:divalent metal cation (Fe/Co/Zn/Cd) transporter
VGAQVGSALLDSERASYVRRGLLLEYATIGYNLLEGLLALAFGFLAGSIALVGFGIDSIIELASGLGLVWRLRLDADSEKREYAERLSLKIVGVCFVALATYVAFDSVDSLIHAEAPRESTAGIVLAVASLIVMPMLARAKRRVAAHIRSAALTADAKQTELCTYLSAILLGGLSFNALFGWRWADPAAALVMVPIIAKEGIDALRGRTCCASCH